MKMNINVFFMCVFIAMLFYGVVTLLPSRSVNKKKQKTETIQTAEAIVAIILAISGLLLMVFAFIVQNTTAQTIYAQFKKYWLIAGLVICVIDEFKKFVNKRGQSTKSKRSRLVGDVEVIYSVSTPEVFNGSIYKVAYETLVQEPEIPFITCELRMKQDNRYIGDLIFEASKSPVSEKDLRTIPISEVHLD